MTKEYCTAWIIPAFILLSVITCTSKINILFAYSSTYTETCNWTSTVILFYQL